MATEVKNYSPDQVIVTIGGHIVSGYEPGTFINIVREQPNFNFTVGPDGKEGVRAKTNQRQALLTVTLRQTSPSNYVFSRLANRDEVEAVGVVPVSVRDINSPDTEFASGKGWVQKPPDVGYAEGPQPRAWQFMLAEVPIIQAGTPAVDALTGTLT